MIFLKISNQNSQQGTILVTSQLHQKTKENKTISKSIFLHVKHYNAALL